MSYNTPVRDELVVNLGGTLPELKSSRGIFVVKHTKRGQTEPRRLRLDTDLSTLEVFSTSTGFINRRMLTRTHYLSLLEEVRPATSVPGGLPATPGRTLVFLFRNRNLYVTVKSRDVCAALVALFRGGPLSHGFQPLEPAISAGARGSEDGTGSGGSRRSQPSPSTASPASSSTSGRIGRSTDRRSEGHIINPRTREERSSIGASSRNLGGGRGLAGEDGRSDSGFGRSRAAHAKLKRSASYSAGPESFASTSSSEDDLVVTAPLQPTPTLSGTSGRSPMSTHSSESPDPIMRARMVGFGSSGLGNDAKPRRARPPSSFKNPWSRRPESDKKATSAAALAAAALTAEDVGVERGVSTHRTASGFVGEDKVTMSVTDGKMPAPEISPGTQNLDRLDVDVPSPVVVNGAKTEMLRRPASAPSIIPKTNELSPVFMVRTEDVSVKTAGTMSTGPRYRSGTPTFPVGRSGKPAALTPQMTRDILDNPLPASQQQQLPAASPLQKVNDFSFNTPLRQGSPLALRGRQQPPSRKEHGDQVSERKIPQLRWPITDDQQWAAREGGEASGGRHQDSTDESSVSPIRRPYGRDEVTEDKGLVAAAHQQSAAIDSSSFDSLEAEGPYPAHGRANPERPISSSEDEENGSDSMSLPIFPHVLPAPPRVLLPRGTTRPRNEGSADGEVAPVPVAMAVTSRLPALAALRGNRETMLPGRNGFVQPEASLLLSSQGRGEIAETTRSVETVDAIDGGQSFVPETFEPVVGNLTIEAESPHEHVLPTGVGKPVRELLPFSIAQPATILAPLSGRSRGSLHSCGSRGSRGTDCTSPDSPPGGAVGEVRASISSLPGPRPVPLMRPVHAGNDMPLERKGPSGFEELWAVLEPAWGMNSSFGTSMAPKVILLDKIYQAMRNFQAAVAGVCVRECGPPLAEACGRCGRAWAVLSSASPQALADFPHLHKIENGITQLEKIVSQYETGAVVRRFTLSLMRTEGNQWDEMLSAGEGADLLVPCQQIDDAIALLATEGREGALTGSSGKRNSGGPSSGGGGSIGSRTIGHQGSIGGRTLGGRGGFGGRNARSSTKLWLPPCPSYWAKGQFDRLTPGGLDDVRALLYEPARFAELARLVTRASDNSPINRPCSLAWDCIRQSEGPALGRALRRALSATLVAAGEFLPLPRVPPPPPAYFPRKRLSGQIEATILHPFLPLGIAGIGGPSGSGKTVLASAVVRDAALRRRFGDRVFWLHVGRGADRRIVSIIQSLADTVYAWMMSDEMDLRHGSSRVGRDGGGMRHPERREPIRFRDENQAIQYVAALCQGPWLAGRGLRCLVVLDDVHEPTVVKALWKSQCQLLVISSVPGLLESVGAEATMTEPFDPEAARKVASGMVEEEVFCEESAELLGLCRGCPLAVAMSGALVQAVMHMNAGGGGDWRTRSRTSGSGNNEKSGEGGGGGGIGGAWSLGIGNTLSTLTAPVGAWMEQVVGGSTLPDKRLADGGTDSGGSGGLELLEQRGQEEGISWARQCSPQAMAWTEVTEKVHAALAALNHNHPLQKLSANVDSEEPSVPLMLVVLTQVALAEAGHILGGSSIAMRCYLSFALLPEGFPLPPPALEELWQTDESGIGSRTRNTGSSFATGLDEPAALEVFEAFRLLGRAGGGEGAAGLVPHGFQRCIILAMVPEWPDLMSELLRRRIRILTRLSSLVGTFDDGCWALGGGSENERDGIVGDNRPGADARGRGERESRGRRGRGRGRGRGDRGAMKRDSWLMKRDEEHEVDHIPTELLGSGPGPPSHGYGGFSRYEYLVASWEALPASHSLVAAASGYLESVRAACKAAQNTGGGSGGWAAARALASAADLQALANRGSEAIAAYEEACTLLAEEAKRNAQAGGVSQWQRTARDTHHKVANMVRDLALLTGHLRKEAPAIRLLQRAVEIHLSVLAASGALVPDLGGGHTSSYGQMNTLESASIAGDSEVEEAAQLLESTKGRGAGITWKALANDDRALHLRLRLQPVQETGEPAPAGRGAGGSSSSGGGAGNGGGRGNLLPYGRLDVVATCVGDLGKVVSCTRQLREAKRIDESAQLAEKVYPILKEILGADHVFTKAALAGFVGQVIVDKCWSQQGSVTGSSNFGGANVKLSISDTDALGPGQHPSLLSPTSRRRLTRSNESRVVSGSLLPAGKKVHPMMALSAQSDLFSPPSPLPPEFYMHPSVVNTSVPLTSHLEAPNASAIAMPKEVPADSFPARGHTDWGGYTSTDPVGGGSVTRDRPSLGPGSSSSDSEVDDGEDSDSAPRGVGALGEPRPNPRVGRGSYGGGSKRLERPLLQWQRDARAALQRGEGATSVVGMGALHPASTLMQHDRYIRHLIRRARAHAFLVTAATKARLNDAQRAKASEYLLGKAREAGAAADMEAVSPEGGGPQMPRLIAWRR